MKPIKLEDLIPEPGEFELKAFPGITHILHPVTLEDTAWMQRRWGSTETIQSVFEKADMIKISELVFRLLVDKKPFEPREIDEYDDDGNKIKRVATGPELLRRSIVGTKEQLSIFHALLKTIGISQPILDDITEAQKKRAVK